MFYLFYQVLQINFRFIIKNNICTYDPPAFRDFQIGLCKTVVSGTYDGFVILNVMGLFFIHLLPNL